ncbi:telomere repeats-binding bouquet formation protein 1 isoform X1 [Oncorhynchus tshawytscha]|uniref:Telomere repeats-binding bouquet formation protein 1-like n=1 Tax=Oncorhynchus tshawytscha TaxID=74940 RepID=A0AAZ3P8F1_ONCTS|nr:telomere repeats-binding bouquet formation protein 1 isoform X1 [Oncorhynchus tshawytscha]XP_042179113.1 telomere repeats-binding bouquet formation protein 1 isoform X1 [Oncorhynchus tshawytscha]XP_042179114.1 telomere repeats-binding bouquet formation protein 1 isoform X1 [Oncorhynchus tshawytscha]XP_042179115.1 telomere repeats-binding bouquet formation protein 1 isoform X1 [Oncorhynchus tshawytscha]
MEKEVSSVSKHNATKTDLSLLLECLKYQMRCPDSQKQALLTIYSICQQREENVNIFREIGGVVFVYNLSKSSAHAEVRETSLFILGTLAEANVYCKQALCRRELFSDLTDGLMQQDSPLTQKRVAVYLISVLVANNRSGQIFAQTSGCLDILLDLFRTSFPLSGKATVKPANITQLFQLWTSVSSALCGCVNNPQNEESQRICVSAFPLVKSWLQQLSHPQAEMVQPICSFIAMTVANNHCAQESFSRVGGLGTLTQTLIHFASDASHSPLACQVSVIMTKTVSACITDNPVLVSGLAGYGLVPPLISLLSSPILDPQGRLIIILTLGHCTEASEEHQSQLLQCGGLSLIITLLTESTSEELRKAATFILQTCKQATVFLRGAVQGVSLGQTGELEPPVDMDGYWRSAQDMLRRINQLERQQAQGAEEEWEEDTPNPPDQQNPAGLGRKELLSPISLPPTPDHISLPYQERRGGGDKSCEESWRGVEWRGQQIRYGRGGEKGEERAMDGERETPVLPVLARVGRDGERVKRDQREENQPTNRGHDLMRVRRFQANEEPQKHSRSSREREKRTRTHSLTHQERESDRAAHRNTLAEQERRTTLHTLGNTQREKKRDRGSAAMRNTYPLYTNTLAEKGKTTQTENCRDEHPGRKRQTVSATGHAGLGTAGVVGQPSGGEDERCSVCLGTGTLVTSSSRPLEGHSQTHTHSQVFKCPAPGKSGLGRQKKRLDNEDVLSVCSELLDSEICKIMETPATTYKPTYRCSGCGLRFSEVTSRSFPVLQRSCPHSCDLHMVLQQATHSYTKCLREICRRRDAHTTKQRERGMQSVSDNCRDASLTPIHKGTLLKSFSTHRGQYRNDHNHVSLTPLKKRSPYGDITLTPVRRGGLTRSVSSVTSRGQERGDVSLTPLKKARPSEDRRTDHMGKMVPLMISRRLFMGKPSLTRERRKFSRDEERYLCRGLVYPGTPSCGPIPSSRGAPM